MAFLSKVVFPNFKSANHVHLSQDHHTLDSDEPVLGSVIPLTLIVIAPTNKQLLDPALDKDSALALQLLIRWGRLHALRTILSGVAFVMFLILKS